MNKLWLNKLLKTICHLSIVVTLWITFVLVWKKGSCLSLVCVCVWFLLCLPLVQSKSNRSIFVNQNWIYIFFAFQNFFHGGILFLFANRTSNKTDIIVTNSVLSHTHSKYWSLISFLKFCIIFFACKNQNTLTNTTHTVFVYYNENKTYQ